MTLVLSLIEQNKLFTFQYQTMALCYWKLYLLHFLRKIKVLMVTQNFRLAFGNKLNLVIIKSEKLLGLLKAQLIL